MGIIKQGILGGFSGKVANIIGTSWKGIAVIKSMPLSVSNPQTVGQVAQRTAMSRIVAFCGLILGNVIKPLMDRFAVRMSGFNSFVQSNIAYFDAVVPSDSYGMKIATGVLTPPSLILTVTDDDQKINITNGNTVPVGQDSANDELYYVIWGSNLTSVQGGLFGSFKRATASLSVSWPQEPGIGQVFHMLAAYRSPDGSKTSNTWNTNDVVAIT
jgi:hypothetical protein